MHKICDANPPYPQSKYLFSAECALFAHSAKMFDVVSNIFNAQIPSLN